MEVRINGELLDIVEQDITFTYDHFRFADALADQWSTDIVLPMTKRNMEILQPYDILDNPLQKYGAKIRCSISIDIVPIDGNMQVTELTENEITATLFLSILPYNLFNRRIGRIVDDDATTIIPWDKNTPWIANGSGQLADWMQMVPYRYGAQTQLKLAQIHPSMRLQKVLDTIGTAIGVSMPTLDTVNGVHRLIATHKTVCPFNDRQFIGIMGEPDSNSDMQMSFVGGQHVVNDMQGYALSKNQEVVTFNRDCKATIDIYEHAAFFIDYGVNVLTLYHNGNVVYGFSNYHMNPVTGITLNISKGDTLSLYLSENPNIMCGGKNIGILLDIRYSDYTVTEDDFGTDLVYPEEGDNPHVRYIDGSNVLHKTYLNGVVLPEMPLVADNSYSYFGYWCNLGDFTIKEMMNSLCWFEGKRLNVNGTVMSLVGMVGRQIDGELKSISPICDNIGKRTMVAWNGDESPITFLFDNEYLEDEVNVHESVFPRVTEPNVYGYIGQYTASTDSDGNVEYGFDELNAAVMKEDEITVSGVVKSILRKPHELHTLNLDEMSNTTQVTVETFRDLRGLDHFYLDGHKYLLVSDEYDVKTGLNTAVGLLCNTSVPAPGPVYADVEHVKAVGSCYIYTGLTMEAGTTLVRCEFKLNMVSHSGSRIIANSRPTNGLRVYTNSNRVYNQSGFKSFTSGNVYDAYSETTASQRKITIAGQTGTDNTAITVSNGDPITILARPDGTLQFTDDVYYIRIYINGTLRREYVPKKRISDSVYGLYDTVTDTFETGSGGGYFDI